MSERAGFTGLTSVLSSSAQLLASLPGLMLPDEDPRVQDFLSNIQLKRRLKSDDAILESLKSGATWPVCHGKHTEARAHISHTYRPVSWLF